MGCDIHMIVQRRRESYWFRVVPPPEDREPSNVRWAAEHPTDPWAQKQAVESWYDGRNYSLFGMLADVRNGVGFAGIDTGDGFVPISQPRGVPDDFERDSEWDAERESYDGFDLGDHSYSWLLLRELEEYDWSRTTTRRGCIPLDVFIEREAKGEKGAPTAWSGAIWGPNQVTVTEDEARAQLTGGGLAVATEAKVSVRVSWTATYADEAGDFYTRVIPALRKLGGPDDVRIVFGFDN